MREEVGGIREEVQGEKEGIEEEQREREEEMGERYEEAETTDQPLEEFTPASAKPIAPESAPPSLQDEVVLFLQQLLSSSPNSHEGDDSSIAASAETQAQFAECLRLYDFGLPSLARNFEQLDRLQALLLELLDRTDLPSAERLFAESLSAQLSALLSRQQSVFAEQNSLDVHFSKVNSLKARASEAAAPLAESTKKRQVLDDRASALRQRIASLKKDLTEAEEALSRIESEKSSLDSQGRLQKDEAISVREQLSRLYEIHPLMKRRRHAAELAQSNLLAEWTYFRRLLS